MEKEIKAIYLPFNKWLKTNSRAVVTTYTIAPPSVFYDVGKEGIVVKITSPEKIRKSAFSKQISKKIKRLIIAEHEGKCIGIYTPQRNNYKKNVILNPRYADLGIEGRMIALGSLHKKS